jgi:hypothetical protein
MSLDQSIQQPSEHPLSLTDLDSLAKQVKEARKEPEKPDDNYQNYPAFDPEELEERAKEFETKFKTSKKSETMALFRELPGHCQEYIMKTMPYQMYWRSARASF